MYRFSSEALSFGPEELIFVLPDYREDIAALSLDGENLRKVDIFVLEHLENLPEEWEDDDTKPLEKWWWHLRKIARREYPAELLPDYLREIYLRAA